MCKRTSSKKASARTGPLPTNFININGLLLSLGDLRKADFSQIKNPKASVISCQKTLIEILDVLRGFAES